MRFSEMRLMATHDGLVLAISQPQLLVLLNNRNFSTAHKKIQSPLSDWILLNLVGTE